MCIDRAVMYKNSVVGSARGSSKLAVQLQDLESVSDVSKLYKYLSFGAKINTSFLIFGTNKEALLKMLIVKYRQHYTSKKKNRRHTL